MSSYVDINSHDGKTFKAYFCEAAKKTAPGIVLIQEIFGINKAMRDLAEIWRNKGYHVIVPDLFWRQEAGLDLDPRNEKEFQRGVKLMQQVDQPLATQDLECARAWLEARFEHDRMAAMGYCFGGRMVIHVAAQARVRCAVSYYGVGLESLIPPLGDTAPALLHIAELDSYVPEDARQILLKEAERREGWKAFVYNQADHAFARPGGQHYLDHPTHEAEARSDAFIQQFTAA